MSGPALLFLLLLGGAALTIGPALRRRLSGLPARQRKTVTAGGLVVAGLLLVAMRLAPLGIVAFVLAGGVVMRPARPAGPAAPAAGPMTRAEALRVLGLRGDPPDADIEAAYRRLITRAHPDAGGSADLAARVNAARDALRR